MSEFFKDKLNIAHDLIDNYEFDRCVELIKNLKIRIHDTELLTKIGIHEENIEKRYQDDYIALSGKQGDPFDSFKKVNELQRWRGQEYLKYYDKLRIDYDL